MHYKFKEIITMFKDSISSMAAAAGLKPSTVLVKEIKKVHLNTLIETSYQINITCKKTHNFEFRELASTPDLSLTLEFE